MIKFYDRCLSVQTYARDDVSVETCARDDVSAQTYVRDLEASLAVGCVVYVCILSRALNRLKKRKEELSSFFLSLQVRRDSPSVYPSATTTMFSIKGFPRSLGLWIEKKAENFHVGRVNLGEIAIWHHHCVTICVCMYVCMYVRMCVHVCMHACMHVV
jgi:hypothetical protein